MRYKNRETKEIKMLATTLMRQQLRCMQNMVGKKPLLIGNGTLVPKPKQFLATSAVNRSSGDHVRMWTMERSLSLANPSLDCALYSHDFLDRCDVLHLGCFAFPLGR